MQCSYFNKGLESATLNIWKNLRIKLNKTHIKETLLKNLEIIKMSW